MAQSEGAGGSSAIEIPLRDMRSSPTNAVSEQFVVERDRRRARRARQTSGEIHRPENLDANAPTVAVSEIKVEERYVHVDGTVWFGIETALVALFTLEYGARCFAHSETWTQLWNWSTSFFPVLDLIAILPFYLLLILKFDMTAIFRFSILRVFRLLRVFRPFRYSNTILLTIEVMFLAVKRSRDALLALGFFVLMALIVFSTLIYFAERGTWDTTLETFVNSDGDPTQFDSIPAAAWQVCASYHHHRWIWGPHTQVVPWAITLCREFASVWEHMGGNLLQGNDEAVAEARRHLNDSPMITRPRPFARARSDSYVPLDDEGGPAVSNHGATTRDLSNLKLAENQQALSRQIDQLAEIVKTQAEEMKAVRLLLLQKETSGLDD
ncbi:hypothetical protein FRC07_011695 [Ceratobasidium sp. 392]|nr:hypothetical protein FRC07_011695 [Ceratobasidium sp. 392]